jgi:serine/threonine-protein kinase HipA
MSDLRKDRTYRGFEDFCVLNARRTDEKYRGSYETSVMKRFAQFADSMHVTHDMEKLFTLIALNCALRNGDAHLKNFGIVYDDVQGEARLAPVFDLVTTSVYIAQDSLALTLNGTTQWPTARELRRLGETRGGGTPARVKQTLQRIDEAIRETARDVQAHGKEHPEFAEIGQRLLQQWENGSAVSLR